MPTADAFDDGMLSPVSAGSDSIVSDVAIRAALVEVEIGYLGALESVGIAPAGIAARVDTSELTSIADLAARSVLGGNPLIPLLADLRSRLPDDVAGWLHKGATSQDIIDTALMLTAKRARAAVLTSVDAAIQSLASLADEHRGTVAAARTLAQHSTPTTWGLRFATWLGGLLDAREALVALVLPVQLAGASGTLASLATISDAHTAARVAPALAQRLGLAESRPWHTTRAPITRAGDGFDEVIAGCGVVAANVITLSRTEIAEVAEPRSGGRGGSSTMPQKRNPVLSVLVRSAALRAPGLVSTLHLCAANAVDERPDGAWHAEWPTFRELLRLAIGASALTAELTAGLSVDVGRARANLALTGEDIVAERRALTGRAGEPGDYLGLADEFIDAAIARARP